MHARRVSYALLAIAVALVAGCADIGSRPDESVGGSVTWTAKTPLPKDAVLHVVLLDLSAAPGGSPVAEVGVDDVRRAPVPYSIRYDPRAIDPAHTYVVEATLSAHGHLLFGTVKPVKVLTGGAGRHAELSMHPPL